MSTTEFAITEPVTAVVHLDTHGGESAQAPLVIGYYEGWDGEIWIDQGGHRVQIPSEHFRAVMKQLKRAHEIAEAVNELQP